MKLEKGITLTSLVIYIVVATIVIGTMAIITTRFTSNVSQIKNQIYDAPEFNQFAMFFIRDVKNNKTATINQGKNQITFADNTVYNYNSNTQQILRNGIVISNKIQEFEFEQESLNTLNTQTIKNIIIVKFKTANMDKTENGIRFVLKYW